MNNVEWKELVASPQWALALTRALFTIFLINVTALWIHLIQLTMKTMKMTTMIRQWRWWQQRSRQTIRMNIVCGTQKRCDEMTIWNKTHKIIVLNGFLELLSSHIYTQSTQTAPSMLCSLFTLRSHLSSTGSTTIGIQINTHTHTHTLTSHISHVLITTHPFSLC